MWAGLGWGVRRAGGRLQQGWGLGPGVAAEVGSGEGQGCPRGSGLGS